MSDVELMRRSAQGDVEAFAQIYDRHAGSLLALSQRMRFARSEGQDLLHDVFLEAWQAVREYDPERATVRTWLLVRARSRALDRLGRHAREESARKTLPPDNPASPQRALSSHEERRIAVRQALAGLEPNVRATLELTYFEGLTAVEIAERMSVPLGTVKSRLARGLQGLQRVLGELGRDGHERG
jgi:RNA polymerase sigma-70 factor (ECF subfamily)